ncbi:polysaccharide deacetylase family protein [Aeoliella mucimassa]|uniref:Peptidoglycan-N-acetylglucosamine deacetylase n=1 Tax=Aeoliella mucimassa TaxID=2527972 RepID=A0A518AL05_9BACT|nr:polysaccharide deacetylase family protein [Aeoliella mucimassa]QDU55364.1 Peptidoglycan-N-acetylglucosamine deacetylase [Aeoliella mucimassa]
MIARLFGWLTISLLVAAMARFAMAALGLGNDWAFRDSWLGIGMLSAGVLLGCAVWLFASKHRRRLKLLAGGLVLPLSCLLIAIFPPLWLLNTVDYFTAATFCFDTSDKVLAITIDDAIDPVTTSAILDLLDEHAVQATFFVMTDTTGEQPELSSTILQRIAETHELGNHQTRDQPAWQMSADTFAADVAEAQHTLSDFGSVRWLRPGAGVLTLSMAGAAESQDLQLLLGNVFPWDSHHTSVSFSSRYVMGRVRPGAVVVLHDQGARGERTLAVLREIIPQLQQQGYRLVTVSELAKLAAKQ